MLVVRTHPRRISLGALCAITLALATPFRAFGQDDLLAALRSKYRITQMNAQGVVASPGTVLTIEADGINAEPYPTMITFENPVVDGQVKQRSKGLGFLKSTNVQILQPGQKVYVTKINGDIQGKEDALKITILTSDALLATYTGNYGGHYQTPKRYSGTLAFKFPKGTLSQMSVDDAAKLISAILSVNPADQVRTRDTGVITRACEPHCGVSATTGERVGGAATISNPNAAPMPTGAGGPAAGPAPTIALGQTPDQVISILGQPSQIIDLGAKKIYKYPDMKVVFSGGKVTDVQ